MARLSLLVAALAAPALVFSASAHAAAAGSAQPAGGSAGGLGQTCGVKISRSASAGVFDVARQVLGNGKCICRVTTGPRSQGGSAESALASLLSRRSCADAPLAASTAATGGGLGTGVYIGGGLLVAGAVAAAAAGGGGGPSSP